MGEVRHCLIEAAENGIILPTLGSQAETLHVFHADLNRCWLGLQNIHYLCNKLVQRHGAWIGSPVQKVRSDIGRNEFENLSRSRPKLIPKGLRIGVDGRLGCAIRGSWSHWNKSQP